LAAMSVEAEGVSRTEDPPDVIPLLHIDPIVFIIDIVRASVAAAGRIRDVSLADKLKVRTPSRPQHVGNESHRRAPVPFPTFHAAIL